MDLARQRLDEWEDVSYGEHLFFTCWNKFMQKKPILCDAMFEKFCLSFSGECAAELHAKKLRVPFSLHLMTMFQFGLLSHAQVFDCLEVYNNACAEVSVDSH